MKILILFLLINQKNFNFSHKKHIEMDIVCTTCHEKAIESEFQKDDLLPGHKECSQCHGIEENCSQCHTEKKEKIERIPLYISNFSHKKHSKFDCSICHEKIKEEEVFLSMRNYAYPVMSQCINCHRENKVAFLCSTCHTDKEEKLTIFHPKNYRFLHSEEAKFSDKNCKMCHNLDNVSLIGSIEIPACNTCHAKENIEFKNHPENFRFSHSFYYYSGESICSSCHNDYKDCVVCHRNEKIYPFDHNSVEWVKANGGLHSKEARLNPLRCVVCHEEKDNVCLTCHGGGK